MFIIFLGNSQKELTKVFLLFLVGIHRGYR